MQPLVRERKSGYIITARAALLACYALHVSNANRKIITNQINDQSINNVETATEALHSELPLNVQEPVVEEVKKQSNGTIEQFPNAMENTRRRIMIRR